MNLHGTLTVYTFSRLLYIFVFTLYINTMYITAILIAVYLYFGNICRNISALPCYLVSGCLLYFYGRSVFGPNSHALLRTFMGQLVCVIIYC